MGRDGSKILVIADDPTLHKLVRILLADKGFQLTSTSGVEEALEAVRRWRPHLAILSLALRELTLFRTLRQMDPGLEVIVISHQADQGSIIEALRLGAVDYLVKPFSGEQLRSSVAKALARFRLRERENRLLEMLSQETQVKLRKLSVISALTVSLGKARDVPAALGAVLDQVLTAIEADAGAIFLSKAEGLGLEVHRGLPPELLQILEEGPTEDGSPPWDLAAVSGEPILLEGKAAERSASLQERLRQAGVVSCVNVPLEAKDQVLGILTVMRFTGDRERFTDHDLEFLITIGYLAGAALEMNRLIRLVEEGRRRLQIIFDGIPDPIALVDEGYRISATNRGAAWFTGGEVHELVGRPCYQVFFKREGPCEGCPLQQVLETGRPGSAVFPLRRPDGSIREMEISLFPLPGQGGVPQVVEYYRDITEQRMKQRHLYHSGKLAAVGQLAAGLAHELGNDLSVISGATQFLLKHVGEGSDFRAYLEAIERNAAAADRIIRGLLAFAKPREPAFTPCRVVPLLEEACLALQGEFAAHAIEVVRRYAEGLPEVFADGELLQQVFRNILLNAAQAMPGGGTITIATAFDREREQILVEIADTGPGIPQAHLARIFDPFFTTKEEGTGLGLSVSYSLIQAHGGTLSVRSREGEGASFTIALPVKPGAA